MITSPIAIGAALVVGQAGEDEQVILYGAQWLQAPGQLVIASGCLRNPVLEIDTIGNKAEGQANRRSPGGLSGGGSHRRHRLKERKRQ